MADGTFTGYLAAEGRVDELRAELRGVIAVYDRLVLAHGPNQNAAWVENVWLNPQQIEIDSIGDAAHRLRDIQRNWALYPFASFRRAQLIAEKLPKVSAKPLKFPSPPPTAPLGSWTLLSDTTLLYSTQCTSAFPNGSTAYVEPAEPPPSQAYLKLWDALTLCGRWPGPGEHCLDMGSCPGSWTWALQQLGAQVTSVDKARIDESILALPRVNYLKRDAFTLEPSEIEPVDWFFSDVICFPERLLELVQAWQASSRPPKNFICTLKFKGELSPGVVAAFRNIRGSRLLHMPHNKHELTWIKVEGAKL